MNTRNALALAIALAGWHGGTIAQQGPRFGVAPPAPAPQLMPVPRRVVVIRPAVLISPYAQAGSHYHSPNSTSTRNATLVRGPYMVGSGQWVPSGVPANALALQWQPGDTMPSAAAASGHWDWQRVDMATLVEMSRRNQAKARAEAPDPN